jgi:hypothetical protein
MFLLSEDAGRTRMLLRERVSVVKLVSAGKDRGPLILPDQDMVALWKREAAGEFLMENFDQSRPVEFRIGSVVLIVGGALQNRKGVVAKRMNGHAYKVDVGGLTVTAKAEQLQLVGDEREAKA